MGIWRKQIIKNQEVESNDRLGGVIHPSSGHRGVLALYDTLTPEQQRQLIDSIKRTGRLPEDRHLLRLDIDARPEHFPAQWDPKLGIHVT